MYYVEFVAVEPINGDIEVDLEGVDTKEEAKEFAIKAVQQRFPTYEEVEITLIKEIE